MQERIKPWGQGDFWGISGALFQRDKTLLSKNKMSPKK
jgi:hypothetical protein